MCLIADVYEIVHRNRELALIRCYSLYDSQYLTRLISFSRRYFRCRFGITFYLKVPRCDLFGLVRIIYDTLWN